MSETSSAKEKEQKKEKKNKTHFLFCDKQKPLDTQGGLNVLGNTTGRLQSHSQQVKNVGLFICRSSDNTGRGI